METENKIDKKVIIGLLLIGFGALLTLDVFDIVNINFRSIIFSWQMILIVIGLVNLLNTSNKTPGLVLIAIGTFFLLPDFFYFDFPTRKLFLPIVFIGMGIIFLTNRGKWDKFTKHHGHFSHGNTNLGEDFLDDVNIFGGGHKSITSQTFMGGKITSIFGGSEYNMTHAELRDGHAEIEFTSIFGGSKLIVPADWKVKTDVVAIFGGFSDKRASGSVQNPNKVLIIRGSVIFGGGEIVSY
ncbi:MAG: hypothetical protein JEZ03_17535 [Bacteroidales bacterium]|nr:hypothetical protein [Bacteroidales bacterium]